jgi:hypothetical protein
MLKVRLMPEFKGADTVLVWGDGDGLRRLHQALLGLAAGEQEGVLIGDPAESSSMTIVASGHSGYLCHIDLDPEGAASLRWSCSRAVLEDIEGLVAPLAEAKHGHQYVDVSGPLAAQLMFSIGEYAEHGDGVRLKVQPVGRT